MDFHRDTLTLYCWMRLTIKCRRLCIMILFALSWVLFCLPLVKQNLSLTGFLTSNLQTQKAAGFLHVFILLRNVLITSQSLLLFIRSMVLFYLHNDLYSLKRRVCLLCSEGYETPCSLPWHLSEFMKNYPHYPYGSHSFA